MHTHHAWQRLDQLAVMPMFPAQRSAQKQRSNWIDERSVQAKGLITKLRDSQDRPYLSPDGEARAMTILDAALKGCRSITGGLTDDHETASPACWAALCVQQAQAQADTSGEWEMNEQGTPHTTMHPPQA